MCSLIASWEVEGGEAEDCLTYIESWSLKVILES